MALTFLRCLWAALLITAAQTASAAVELGPRQPRVRCPPSLAPVAQAFFAVLPRELTPGGLWQHLPMPQETHATLYHPAALRALRQLFKPAP